MKWILLLAIVFLMSDCSNSSKKQTPDQKTTANSAFQTDTLELKAQIEKFKATYNIIVTELYDSVSRFQTEGIDFSDITEGIERKYRASNNELTKELIGFELAKNYMLCYRNSDELIYLQNAKKLFYSFICFRNGETASKFLDLELSKVRFIEAEWSKFSDQDKESILFYGLLRGFDNGLPDILKDIK